ncbi:MAG: hypothetical protein NWR14_03785 [Flavobacteriaceae bacterium]|jgi:hypothetical protein|nr:hypothetical protein [Flavobacteriaceae bacterium]
MNDNFYSYFKVLLLSAVLSGCGSGEDLPNEKPVLTSPEEAVFPQTRTGTVYTIVGLDPDGDKLSYSISGPDASSFLVDQFTGELSFRVAPNVDDPGSIDGDNFYFIDVTVEDPSSESDTKMVIVEVSRYDPDGPYLFDDGTAFLGPDTIAALDPSILESIALTATEIRTVPDKRYPNDVATEVYIFEALYGQSLAVEIVVNTQIKPFAQAEQQAELYAKILGQLDPMLIQGINTVFIHPGDPLFSGPVGSIIAHIGRAETDYIPRGVLEEVMAHEAIHASIDPLYWNAGPWVRAQKSDVNFVTKYSRDFPEREDLAESYVSYLMVKKANRNSPSLVKRIQEDIPNRIQFFKNIGL